jgi:hypothetical protein
MTPYGLCHTALHGSMKRRVVSKQTGALQNKTFFLNANIFGLQLVTTGEDVLVDQFNFLKIDYYFN